MAWKGKTRGDVDYQSMRSTLIASGIQKDNNDLFEVVSTLLNAAQIFKDTLLTKVGKDDEFPAIQLSGKVPVATGGTYSDKYIPVVTLGDNVGGTGVDDFYYYVNGTTVTVFGQIQIDPISVGVNTEVGLSLPILSYFKFDYNCVGVGYSGVINQGAAVIADVVNNVAIIRFLSISNTSFNISVHFSYEVMAQ